MHIHTYKQNELTIKGKYDVAVNNDDEIMWTKINKEYMLPMWLVSHQICEWFLNLYFMIEKG